MLSNLNNLEKARTSWLPALPEWVKLLADACDRAGQTSVGQTLGYSSGTVSRIINAKYPGDLAELEKQVRAAFGAERVMCPVFGDMGLKTCIANRRRTRPANWAQVRLARACPDCPNNTDRTEGE